MDHKVRTNDLTIHYILSKTKREIKSIWGLSWSQFAFLQKQLSYCISYIRILCEAITRSANWQYKLLSLYLLHDMDNNVMLIFFFNAGISCLNSSPVFLKDIVLINTNMLNLCLKETLLYSSFNYASQIASCSLTNYNQRYPWSCQYLWQMTNVTSRFLTNQVQQLHHFVTFLKYEDNNHYRKF